PLARGDHRARAADRGPAPPPVGPARLALPARRVARRPEQRPHHRRDGLPAVPGDAPRRRPRGAAPGRRDRVRQRRSRHERQRRLRPDAGLRGDRGPRRPAAGRAGGRGAGGAPPRWRRAVPGHPAQRGLGCRDPAPRQRAGPRPVRRRGLPRRVRAARPARPLLRRLALPPPDPRADGAGAGLPGDADRPRPRRRAARPRPLRRAARRRVRPLGGQHPRTGDLPERLREAGRPGDALHEPRPARRIGAALLGAAGRCLAPVLRGVHRGVRRGAVHVREQLPGGQGVVQLRHLLERLQAPDPRGERRRARGPLQRQRGPVLPPGVAGKRI
ncbi:MAG: Purine/pyrimidine phosphoribosyl transferase, partial [uncultured Thermomicrobiales bacterium]